MRISFKGKIMKCGNETTILTYGKKIDVRSKKNIRSANKLVNFRPVEIPKTKIENFVGIGKSFQFGIRIIFEPCKIALVFLSE